MTTRRGRRQLPTDGQSWRIQAIPVSQAIDLAHCPTTSHDDDQVEADPPMAQHGLRQPRGPGLQPRADDARRGHGGRPRDPGHPAVRLSAPRHPPRPHPGRTQWTPEGTDTGRPHRTPEAGHWTPGRSDTRTGHRSLGQAPVDTGHRRGQGNDSTAGVRTSWASSPSDHMLGRPTVFLLSYYQATAGSLCGPGRASAHYSPRMISGRA
jgi:hypothetical protein